jgi:hypothetical protein
MANLQGGLGEYVWDSDKNRFTNRITNDGTEDRRFVADGQCSFLNGFISLTGYTPQDPQAYQQELLGIALSKKLLADARSILEKGECPMLSVATLPSPSDITEDFDFSSVFTIVPDDKGFAPSRPTLGVL